MGCLRITYEYEREGLEKSTFYFRSGLEEKVVEQNFYTNYTPFGAVAKVWNNTEQTQQETYRNGYQGQYAEMDTITGWNAFELRMYDPLIGRWLQVDPYREFASPYNGMGNNPMNAVDPDGGDIIYRNSNGDEIGRSHEKWYQDFFGLANKNITLSDDQLAAGTFVNYVYEDNGYPGHALIQIASTGEVWEAHNPTGSNGIESGGANYIDGLTGGEGGAKSQVYRFDNLDKQSDFWTYLSPLGKERGDLKVSTIWVPDKVGLMQFLNGSEGRVWDYHASGNNCKHFCMQAIQAGGGNPFLGMDSPFPSDFYFEFSRTIQNPTRRP